MKKIKRKFALSLFFILVLSGVSFAQSDDLLLPEVQSEVQNSSKNNSYFNIANIVDSFLTNDTKQDDSVAIEKSQIRREFIAITSKFNQGNAKVAYDEYNLLIDKVNNDTSLLALARVFYEIGFFSLGDKAIEKIVYKNQFYDNILDLENSYKPRNKLSIEEEIAFAKLYASIYFDNSADEAASELLKHKIKYLKHDFYNHIVSRAFMETKQYAYSLPFINRAIAINPTNVSYRLFKADILIKIKKYKEAYKEIEKLEKFAKKNLLLVFAPEIKKKKEEIAILLSKDSAEKKYHIVNKTFLEGNFEKAKKDCQNILNFDKDNDEVISLYAKSELALGNTQRANTYFVNAYKLDKKNLETIVGLGDIRYLHGDYKNAVKIYKKAYKKNKKDYEVLIKLATAQRQYAKNPKELKKLELQLDKMPKNQYMAYYDSAISIAQKNAVLKEDFLKRTLAINPLQENALGELIELHLKNKNYKLAKALIYNASFTLEKNYYYYYLCGLYSQATNKIKDAMLYYKTSLSLNPNFEIANTRILKLIPNVTDEEI